MALRFERRHLVDLLAFHKRYDGGGSGVLPEGEFCLLLNADPGTDDKTLQLNTDTGTDTHCLELNTSTT